MKLSHIRYRIVKNMNLLIFHFEILLLEIHASIAVSDRKNIRFPNRTKASAGCKNVGIYTRTYMYISNYRCVWNLVNFYSMERVSLSPFARASAYHSQQQSLGAAVDFIFLF